MIPPNLHMRRATVDDLAGLRPLWKDFGFQVSEFEKRLTEFQLVETADGKLLGAIGFKVAGKHGLIHSEAYTHPEEEEELRSRLWERVQNLARNHALARLWCAEQAPFWHHSGLADATPEDLAKLPPVFGNSASQWRTMQLREETSPTLSLEAELDLFKQASQESTAKMMRQARTMKLVAAVIAFIFFVVVAAGVGYLMYTRSRPPR